MKKDDSKYYALKALALVAFGVVGVFILLSLIGIALAQKSIFGGVIMGLMVVLFAPVVNTVTGFFDGSVEPNFSGAFSNYRKVLVSLIFSLLFLLFMFPFIAAYAAAVLGAMLLVVILVGYGIVFFQEVLNISLGASSDIGFLELTKYFVIIGGYELLFGLGYYAYSKYEEKIWDRLRKVFLR